MISTLSFSLLNPKRCHAWVIGTISFSFLHANRWQVRVIGTILFSFLIHMQYLTSVSRALLSVAGNQHTVHITVMTYNFQNS
mmetsp:Transcript_18123/g.43356  ORF Transcript_18123/g.43356 Transcript_18123/m.43356 type:complete len:82 (+) Transcript_18123:123-368(+)